MKTVAKFESTNELLRRFLRENVQKRDGGASFHDSLAKAFAVAEHRSSVPAIANFEHMS